MMVNLLPLLSYQKIYFDFFSNSQWEKHLAYAYNVDYWTGGEMDVSGDWLKIRYSDYPKDYFMGVLPASQYGSVAVLPSTILPQDSSNSLIAVGLPRNRTFIQPAGTNSVETVDSAGPSLS